MKSEALENFGFATPSSETIKLKDHEIDLIEFLQNFICRTPFGIEMVSRCECKRIKLEDFIIFCWNSAAVGAGKK